MNSPTNPFSEPPDDAPWRTPSEIFGRLAFQPEPCNGDDMLITGRLWELIYAMAARRFFLIHTNLLSDAELYDYLTREWMHEGTADLDPNSGWNCHVDICDDEQDWLMYFADEAAREAWLAGNRGKTLPPRLEPPFDRDRWLPVPPPPDTLDMSNDIDDDNDDVSDEGTARLSMDARGGYGKSDVRHGQPEDQSPDDPNSNDPLGLKALDSVIHRQHPLDGHGSTFSFSSDMFDDENDNAQDDSEPDEAPEEWDAGYDMGAGRWARPIDVLPEFGVLLMPPAELTDESVRPKLWELLHSLACIGFFIRHTNHLSDRALYEMLWQKVLRVEAYLPADNEESAWLHDIIGGDSAEEEEIWLRYYATDEERAEARAENPFVGAISLPAKSAPVANRDWRLPQAPLEDE